MYKTLADNIERGKRGGGRSGGGDLRELAAFLWVEVMLTRQEWVLGEGISTILRIIVVVYRVVGLFTQKPFREISPNRLRADNDGSRRQSSFRP